MHQTPFIKRAAIHILFVTVKALRRVLRSRRLARIFETAAVITLVLLALTLLHRWSQWEHSPIDPDVPTALEMWQRTH